MPRKYIKEPWEDDFYDWLLKTKNFTEDGAKTYISKLRNFKLIDLKDYPDLDMPLLHKWQFWLNEDLEYNKPSTKNDQRLILKCFIEFIEG